MSRSGEDNSPIPLRVLQTLLVVLTSALLVMCVALWTREREVYVRLGHVSRIYMLFAAIISVAFIASACGCVFARRMAPDLVKVLRVVHEHNGTAVLLAGLMASAAFAGQLEAWLLPGHEVIGAASALFAISSIIIVLTSTGVRLPSMYEIKRCPRAAAKALSQVAGSRTILAVLLTMVAIRTVLIIYYAAISPLLCDEAATVELYATSIGTALTRYDTPNNHLLNSVLVRLSTALFGSSLLGIRFFAVSAGALSPVAVFALAKRVFNSRAALAAATLECVSLWVLTYSFQARAYAFVSSMAPVVLWCLFYALEKPEHPRRWTLLTISCSVALLVIPTAVYLVGTVLLFSIAATSTTSVPADRTPLSLGCRNAMWSAVIVALFGFFVYFNPMFYVHRTALGSRVFGGFSQQPHSVLSLGSDVLNELLFGRLASVALGGYRFFGWAIAFLVLTGIVMLFTGRRYSVLLLTASLVIVPLLTVVMQPDLPFARNLSFVLTWAHVLAGFALTDLMAGICSLPGIHEIASAAWPSAVLMVFGFVLWQGCGVLGKYLRASDELLPATRLADWLIANTTEKDAIVCDTCLDYMIQRRIGSQRRITTVIEWWATGTPSGSRVIVVPFQGDPENKRFVTRSCGRFKAAQLLTSIGRQEIYLCE